MTRFVLTVTKLYCFVCTHNLAGAAEHDSPALKGTPAPSFESLSLAQNTTKPKPVALVLVSAEREGISVATRPVSRLDILVHSHSSFLKYAQSGFESLRTSSQLVLSLREQKRRQMALYFVLAEREGFEPSRRFPP